MPDYFTKDGENFVPVKDSLHTQESVDRVVQDRLERERNKFKDYDDLKGKVETVTKELADKSTAWESEKTDLNGKLKKATLEVDKVKIVSEFKLSDDLAEFVVGETPDEMRKRAEKLAKGVKGGTIVIDKEEKPADKGSGSKQIASKLFGKKSDD